MRILVIDDNRFSRNSLKRLLQYAEPTCEVSTADSGIHALETMALEEPFEIITIDYHMPGMDGFEVAKYLQGEGCKARLILVTWDVQDSVVARAASVGIGFVGKPLSEKKAAQLLGKELPGRPLLSESDRDTVSEFFNIAVGRAASSLSDMAGKEVLLSLPDVTLLAKQDFNVRDSEPINLVYQKFSGSFGLGGAALSFPEKKGIKLACDLLGCSSQNMSEELRSQVDDTLQEVGNVVLNACIGALGNIAMAEIGVGVSEVSRAMNPYEKIVHGLNLEPVVLELGIQFNLAGEDVGGRILFVVEIEKLRTFIQLLESSLLSN